MYPTLSYFIEDLIGIWIPLPFATFGIFMAFSFLISSFFLKLELKRKEKNNLLHAFYNKKGKLTYPHEIVENIVLIAVFSGLVGARIFSILEYPDDFIRAPLETLFSFSGFTFYGGLIFGAIAVVMYARKVGIRTIYLVDAAAPALMLAYAIGRMGCQLAGDGDWGIDNLSPKPDWLSSMPDWVWAYNYPHNVINAGIPIPGCNKEYCHVLVNPVFPTPLYEIIACLFLFGMLWLLRKRIHTAGILFSIYLIFNGIERFLIEKIRIDSEYNILGFFIKQAEIISLLLIMTGTLLWIAFRFQKNNLFIKNI